MGKLARTYATGRLRRGDFTQTTYRETMLTLDRWCGIYGNRQIKNVNRADLDRFLDSVGALKPSTRRLYLSRVVVFLRWLVVHGHTRPKVLHELPKVRQPRSQPRVLTPEQVALVLTSAPDTRLAAVMALDFWTGLRCVEISRLNCEDIDRYAKTIFVTGKSGHERFVPMPPELESALDAYLLEQPATTGPLIRSLKSPGCGLLPSTITSMGSQYLRDIGVKKGPFDGVSMHTGRRQAATDLYEVSGDIRLSQELLGHADLSSMRSYLRRGRVAEVAAAMTKRSYPSSAA